jgi:hypothetical protein
MTDTRVLSRLLDELVWTLRREGLLIGPAQVLDLESAVATLGWGSRFAIEEAAAAITVQRAPEMPRFRAAFASFFSTVTPSRDLFERLLVAGFTPAELAALRDLLDALPADLPAHQEEASRFRALLEQGAELDRLLRLAGTRRELDELRSPLQVGFFTQRLAQSVGLPKARQRLAALRQSLRGALGERGDALADALARELDRAQETLRDDVARSFRTPLHAESAARKRDEMPFTSLSSRELEEVSRAVRSFADRLRGRERVRTRRARHGAIHPGLTFRRLLRTGGVPFTPVRRRKRRDKPRLLLLCDVSDSVRAASRFMLELVYAAHELFDKTRSFLFVSELGEATKLFEREPARVALAAAYGGEVIPVTDNSNYGRVFRAFEARYISSVDRRTTVVILGDGRTNFHEASAHVLERLRARARALYWFSTEPRAAWSSGDSAMRAYAPHCTAVLEVTTAAELEAAARTLVYAR